VTARTLARALPAPRLPRPRRSALIALALAAAVGGLIVLGYFTLRDSSFFAVKRVEVSGLGGQEGARVQALLREAAADMTTLHVRTDQLRTALAPYPIVKSLHVETDLPHTLKIRVVPYQPVAVVSANGRSVPVAGDGTVLAQTLGSPTLPVVRAGTAPSGERVADSRVRAAVRLLAAAPPAMRTLVRGVRDDRSGLTLTLRHGPRLIFGSAVRLHAKWAAAIRVLAARSAAGAQYIDVRTPERPLAGPFADAAAAATADAQLGGIATPAGATPGAPGATSAAGSSQASGAASGAPNGQVQSTQTGP
jgi:cell division protein FtsQ